MSRTATRSDVGQALAQRRLAEAQRRLRALADNDASTSSDPTPGNYPIGAEGTDTGENIASAPPAPEAPAFGGGPAEASPDQSTTVEALDDYEPAGDYGDREQVLSSTRHRAEDTSNEAVARPDDRENVEAPVANQVDNSDGGGTDSQFSESGWDNNADNREGDSDDTSTMVPDGSGRTPMQTGAAKKEAMVLKKASASQVYQIADLYTELGLVPHEQRYAAIAEIEKMPEILATHTIKILGRVKQVHLAQMPQGRVARTAGAIPTLGKSAARTPSMARQAESRRLASSAEDTLLLF